MIKIVAYKLIFLILKILTPAQSYFLARRILDGYHFFIKKIPELLTKNFLLFLIMNRIPGSSPRMTQERNWLKKIFIIFPVI